MKRNEFNSLYQSDNAEDKIKLKEYFKPFFIGQGFGYKYLDKPFAETDDDEIIYIPEMDYVDDDYPSGYTKEYFLELFNGNEKAAEELFNMLDWQSPDTLFEESVDGKEIKYCKECDKYYWDYFGNKCQICGLTYSTKN